MNGLRTNLATLVLFLGSAVLADETPSPSEEALTLAACRARYTAVLEHAWLMQDNVEAARMRRDLFAAMLDAVINAAPDRRQIERQLLTFRIRQKRAATDLLMTARFGTDDRRARFALNQIKRQLTLCDRLVIGVPGFGA